MPRSCMFRVALASEVAASRHSNSPGPQVPRQKLSLQQGGDAAQDVGPNMSERKHAGLAASELSQAGFTVSELSQAGLTPSELEQAGLAAC